MNTFETEIFELPRSADNRVRELKELGYTDAVWYYSSKDPTKFVVKFTTQEKDETYTNKYEDLQIALKRTIPH